MCVYIVSLWLGYCGSDDQFDWCSVVASVLFPGFLCVMNRVSVVEFRFLLFMYLPVF